MSKDSLTVTDNRTGKTYEVPISYGTYPDYGAYIAGTDLHAIKGSDDDFGLLVYDAGYRCTGACKSAITFIDGEKGILRHRGYSIEDLAEQSNYLEVTYMLLYGELPTKREYEEWEQHVKDHSLLNESIRNFLDGYRYESHTMGMLVGVFGAISTFYIDAREMATQEEMDVHITRLIAKVPTIAAFCYRRSHGRPYVYPDPSLSYCGNLLRMFFAHPVKPYTPDPVLERALDLLFVLHADHEQNCSTSTMRMVGSSNADPYSAIAGAAAALYGPAHGGANEAVLKMLTEIGSVKNVSAYIERVKKREVLLQGFGHAVYRNYDPRATIIKKAAYEVFEVTGKNPLIDIALELEQTALDDDFFVSRKLFPNVDFYSGIIYQAMGLPPEMMTVVFASARTAGWLAQWREMRLDEDQKIARPRQIYTGEDRRTYVPIGKR